ncbi:ring-opening amidohydrolase [Tardiphaga sp.]|uniref:cyanuric acid amidohydrolase n=1 Tax=Tardiphaga sp. TaxID=1926292 RepID=UPI0026142E8C|nr:ring-opening amidohydrolase [Tardiphaga sp.]MDB5619659.1 ring-opening amidohydrolase [Tardiphaga sp.]
MEARIHKIAAGSPDDVSGLEEKIAAGVIDPRRIVAILGKTEGNGCVNDFTRGFGASALKASIARFTGEGSDVVERRVVIVMSGGTEGGLSPHWLVFEVVPGGGEVASGRKALAIGTAVTRPFAAHEVGRMAQIEATAAAVREAMLAAQIEDVSDVHYVQVKCPLLTKSRIAAAKAVGKDVATEDTLKSMAFSRGASALGVALALGEVSPAAVDDTVVCRDFGLYSNRASTSAGVELLENQILVVGNSRLWAGDQVVAHDVMQDAIDSGAVVRALCAAGLPAGYPLGTEAQERLGAVLCKAEASESGLIRGARHTMLDDSDIASSRHARSVVGGVVAGVVGSTMLFVSGGAEHQGPNGGGPIAVIARMSPN